MNDLGSARLALAHDWMVTIGGSEKVVAAMHQMWPEAPIYTTAYDPERLPEFRDADVHTSWLDRIELVRRKHQLFTLPRVAWFRHLDLSEYDIVISSSSSESKYARTGPTTLHLCYCHTPVRYYWSDYELYRQNPPFGRLNPAVKVVFPALVGGLRRIDFAAAQRVDGFIANSRFVQERIRRFYERDSVVIYPPVEVDRFVPSDGTGDYYLVMGRQVAYKRLDLAVDAFNELGLPLKVAGVGEEIDVHGPRAAANIEFLGHVPQADVPALMAGARALIFAGEEDFGIVPVEAMAAGRPVIAYGSGGALESIVDGVTGVFFHQPSGASLAEAVRRFETLSFDHGVIRARAEEFGQDVFARRLTEYVEESWARFRAR